MSAPFTLESAARVLGGEVKDGQVRAPGPGHSAADRSLVIKLSDENHDGFVVHSFAGDDPIKCKDYLRDKLGLPAHGPKKNGSGKAWTVISEHIYRSETGEPYLRVKKCLDEKGKRQYPQAHWDGRQWLKSKPAGPKIPYLLPQLLAAPTNATVYFCEGEKDADNLAKLSLVSTTASEGASAKWDPALGRWFKDGAVVILPDADKPGRRHGEKVARALNGIAASVKVLDLFPDSNDGSDVSNWLETDTAGVRLARMAREGPLWEPDSGSGDDLIAELAGLDRLAYAKRRKAASETDASTPNTSIHILAASALP